MTRGRIALVVAFVAAAARADAADAPSWLEQAARVQSAPIESGADAVVLLDERNVTIADDGRITTRRTYAVRVLTKAGASARRCARCIRPTVAA